MSRYIDSEAIMEIARDGYHSDFGRSMADLTSLRELIEDTPTADVVEVVRCKDCKYRGAMLSVPKGVFYTCKKYLLPYCKPDDYCSYGERMDGETDDR